MTWHMMHCEDSKRHRTGGVQQRQCHCHVAQIHKGEPFQRLYRPLTQDLKQNQSSRQVRRENAGAKLAFSRNLEPKTTSRSTERCETDQHST
jgi:hypothetical protein